MKRGYEIIPRRCLVPASRHDPGTCTVTSDLTEQPIDPANCEENGKGARKGAGKGARVRRTVKRGEEDHARVRELKGGRVRRGKFSFLVLFLSLLIMLL